MNASKKFKRICTVLTAASLLMFSGCEKKAPSGATQIVPKQKIVWGIVRYNPYIKTVNPSSEILDYLSDRINCEIEFRYYDSMNAKIIKQLLSGENRPNLLTTEAFFPEEQLLLNNHAVYPAEEILGDALECMPKETRELLSDPEGNLYGIPGRYATEQQLFENRFVPSEGVYAAQPYYDLMGRPAINSTEDLLRTAGRFKEEFSSLRNRVQIPDCESEEQSKPIPIVLGNSGSGLETVKHLFGIYPVFEQNGNILHSIASPDWKQLTLWLHQLSGINEKSVSLTGKPLSSALGSRTLFYIGSSACINDINGTRSAISYERLELSGVHRTFCANPYGSCQTYVFRDEKKLPVLKNLVSYLLSDEGQSVVKFGIRNKHWISTEEGAVQLGWVTERAIADGEAFTDDIGIGQLLFLTDTANDNLLTPDLLISEKNPFYSIVLGFVSGSNEAIKLTKLHDYETDLCQRAASLSAEEHPQKLSLILSDLSYFPLYAKQYEITSIEERFRYWRTQNLKGVFFD